MDVGIEKSNADFNNRIQYQVNNGEWKDVGNSKDTGATKSIQAPPGSTVRFRLQNPVGDTFQAGTSANRDGMDHGKVTTSGNGVRLGMEDYANDTSFNDANIVIKDGPRRW